VLRILNCSDEQHIPKYKYFDHIVIISIIEIIAVSEMRKGSTQNKTLSTYCYHNYTKYVNIKYLFTSAQNHILKT